MLGTYYVVPYTTGCKFKIAEMPNEGHESLVSQGGLSPKAEVAVRELHSRYDTDLDQLLDINEFRAMFQEVSRKSLVCVSVRSFVAVSSFI